MAFDFLGTAGSLLNGSADLQSLGSTIGSALPIPFASQIGGFAGNILGKIGGVLGGHKTDEKSQSSDVNKCADANQLTGTQAGAIIAAHCDISSDHFDDLARYCAGNNARFLQLLAEYNNSHPGSPITPGNQDYWATQYTPTQQQQVIQTLMGASSGLLPAQVSSPFPLPASLGSPLLALPQQVSSPIPYSTSLTGQQIKDAAKAGYDGAVQGVSDSLMKTDEGKTAQWAGVKQFAKDNGIWLGPLGLITLYGLGKAAKIIK